MNTEAIYLVYSVEQYYPSAGMGDVVGIFNNEQEARSAYDDIGDQPYKWKELIKVDLEKLWYTTIAST